MNSTNILSMLGISQRARKLISGQDSVIRAINTRKIFLVILSTDTSENTRNKIIRKANRNKIPVFFWGRSEELGKAIGKEQRKVIGITDFGIAEELIKRLNFLTGVGDIDETTRI